MTRVATIIPAHNAERFIRATLASVAQSGTDRIIVSLDRCTDRTEDVVRRSGVDAVMTRSPAPGVSAARNHGATLARDCGYLRFVDADDLVRPGSARMLTYVLHANRVAVAAFGNVAHIDVNGRAAYADMAEDAPFASGDLLVPLLAGNLIACPSIVVLRREAFEQVGGFDAALSHAEDWHLWTRLATQGEYMHVRRVVADYRVHRGSASLNDRMSAAPTWKPSPRFIATRASGMRFRTRHWPPRNLWRAPTSTASSPTRRCARDRSARQPRGTCEAACWCPGQRCGRAGT
jgi:glycosyltransferase involved in cell wall biosynthesis